MLQPDLFDAPTHKPEDESVPKSLLDMPGLLDRITASCERPHYNFMLLTLIAEASASTGSAGPYVKVEGERVPVRDWLCDAMSPVGRRGPRRRRLRSRVHEELASAGLLPDEPEAIDCAVDAELCRRLRQSGRTNVSRAVSELVRAGLLTRYYQGDYVDHHHRGGQRQAVYTITDETRRALAQGR